MIKKNITLIDRNWVLIDSIKLTNAPRANEIIHTKGVYYTVINTIHMASKYWLNVTDTYIIVEKMNGKS